MRMSICDHVSFSQIVGHEHTHMCSILENVSGALEQNVYSAIFDVQFNSVQSLSRVQLFAIP